MLDAINHGKHVSPKASTGRCSNQPGDATRPQDVYTSREEEWQFPSQIMPVVRDTVAHAGFKITKVDTSYPSNSHHPFRIAIVPLE